MLKVKDIMTNMLFTLQDDDSLKNARQMMEEKKIRHIPIINEQGKFIGLLSNRDILSATISKLADIDDQTQDEIDAGIPINEIMKTDVATVSPETDLKEAATTLLNHKYGCLPVQENNRLIGILTESDFLKLTIHLMDALENAQ